MKAIDMKEDQALLAMTLIARRATSWAHDVICSRSINDGKVSDDAIVRFKRDIQSALEILDRNEL